MFQGRGTVNGGPHLPSSSNVLTIVLWLVSHGGCADVLLRCCAASTFIDTLHSNRVVAISSS